MNFLSSQEDNAVSSQGVSLYPLIRVQELTKIYYPNIVALDNVELDVQEGELISIVGKSGAGKTTLLNLLLAEELPTQGQLLVDGEDVAQIDRKKLPEYRRRVGVVFQDYKLLYSRTVFENVAYVLEVMGAEDEAIQANVAEVLRLVGLSDKSSSFPEQISDGEKQRVAIARALIHRPKVILADEPTGNLDPYHTHDIIRLLTKINDFGTTIILATHNKEVVNRLGRRVITLEDGRIIRDDPKGRFVL